MQKSISKYTNLILLLGLTLFGPLTNADVVSARNSAMGDTGVASSRNDVASLFNPALLTKKDGRDRFSIVLPSVGVFASDQEEVIDILDDLTDDFDLLDEQIISGDPGAFDTRDLVIESLEAISGSPVTIEAGAAFVLAVPLKEYAFALDIRGSGDVAVLARFEDSDTELIDDAIATNTSLDDVDLDSDAVAVGATVAEVVLSGARRVTLAGRDFSFAVAPKFQTVETILFIQDADDFDSDDFDADEFTREETGFNLDAGFAWYLNDSLTVGATLRNLISDDISTILSETGEIDAFEISTELDVGIAYENGWLTAAADLDILPVSTFSSVDDSQFFSAGVEFDAAKWAQLRLGAKVDIRSTRENVVTAGIGLSPFNVLHLGITGIAGTSNTFGGVVEFKLTL